MFISKIQLINFRRFTEIMLDISEQTPPPKLVLIIGANGSGKSCIFDAFEAVSSKSKDDRILEPTYYRKNAEQDFQVTIKLSHQTTITRHDNKKWSDNLSSTTFYGRSSLRQVPQLSRKTLEQVSQAHFENDFDRPRKY